MNAVCARSMEKGWRHFLYGGNPGVAESLKARLESKYEGIQIVGTYEPPFRPLTEQEDREVIRCINAARPDILWVGIGTPKQEIWMSEHLGNIDVNVMVGVGAAFDFLSGLKAQAPHWVQRLGMEWLFRLSTEPKRLWPRYSQYPFFGLLVLAQFLGLRRFPRVE
jgi:N-acetylglucosaminyldiphosphoundecaprenol N-acetyl-beta-D-mannosaminyltransferase